MTWWMICLIVLAVLAAIGCIPVGVDGAYGATGVSLRIKIWLFRVTLLPRPEKRKKPKEKKKTEQKEETREEKPKKEKKDALSFPKGLDGIFTLLGFACDVLGDLRRKLRVEKLYLHIIFGGSEDAAKAAVNYGRAWAVIGALTPTLERLFVIRARDVQPELRYDQQGMTAEARLVLTITIGRALGLSLRAGVKFLKLMKEIKKGGATNESSSV